jgi:prophage DNA circulation protein
MSWQDRIRTARYTSPGGAQFTFDFEDVSESVEKKTTAFEFPSADGTYVQDLGRSGRRYPLRIIIWGDNYDIVATNFLQALEEKGIGRLTHPLYGEIDVVPVETITRNDALKTQANQAVFQVTFFQTIRFPFPTGQTDIRNSINTSINEFNDSASTAYENNLVFLDVSDEVATKNEYLELLDESDSVLQVVITQSDDNESFQRYNNILNSIKNDIDSLIKTPSVLAAQTVQFLQVLSSADATITDTTNAYNDLIVAVIDPDAAIGESSNDFYTRDLYATTYIVALALGMSNAQYITKDDALNSAELLLNLFTSVVDWRDVRFETPDTGEAYQQMQQTVALTAGYLIELSFTLKERRTILLDRERTIIDLSAELLGSIDDQLDFLITSNQLSGSDILTLPAGKALDYYV